MNNIMLITTKTLSDTLTLDFLYNLYKENLSSKYQDVEYSDKDLEDYVKEKHENSKNPFMSKLRNFMGNSMDLLKSFNKEESTEPSNSNSSILILILIKKISKLYHKKIIYIICIY